MARDLTITLQDRPGVLAELGEALGGAGVNIEGFFGYASGGTGTLHLLFEDAQTARSALEGAGFAVEEEREVVVVDVEDRPGALGVIARRISDAGVSLDLGYLATKTRVVLGAADLDAVRRAVG